MRVLQSLARHTPISLMLLALLPAILVPWHGEPTLRIAIHEGVEGVAVKTLAGEFSRDRTVAVEIVELPYDELYDSELQQLDSDSPRYDVIMMDDPWLPALLNDSKGVTRLDKLDLREACKQMELVEDFAEPTLIVSRDPKDTSAITCDSAFYALPFVGNVQLFVVRSGQAPATWDEVLKITLGQMNGNAGYVTRVGSGNPIVTDFMPILWSLSPTSFRTSLERDDKFIDALAYLGKLGQHGRANRGTVSFDDFDLAIYLAQGQASMSIAWSAWVMAMSQLPSPYKERLLSQIETMPVPSGHHALGAWLLAVPAKLADGQKSLARDFLLYATDREHIKAAALAGNPPPRKSVLQDAELVKKYPYFPLQLRSLETATPRPRTPHWREVERRLGDCLSALYEAAITDVEAGQRIDVLLTSILANQPLNGVSCQDDEWFDARLPKSRAQTTDEESPPR